MTTKEDEKENEVTLFNIKYNLDNYCTWTIKRLISFLIDSTFGLTDEKNALAKKVENQELELVTLPFKFLKMKKCSLK